MTHRSEDIDHFLLDAGWSQATRTPLGADASTRSYTRLTLKGRTAFLLDQPQGAESPVAGKTASVESRRKLGYNAIARLAGADVGRFAAVSRLLRTQGISAPEIYAVDAAKGLVLIEDLGDSLYADVIANGGDAGALYDAAAELLAHMHARPAPEDLAPGVPLFAYDEAALIAETDLMTQWYFPLALHRQASADEVAEHRDLWHRCLGALNRLPPVIVHRDFHAQNLLWLPERKGIARVGVIDFQDMVAGSPAYDLISLTEDARRDVSPDLAKRTTDTYLHTMQANGHPLDEARFSAEMAFFAAQRNAKIVGIFARLYKRDGKEKYLEYLPRVWRYLTGDFSHPAMRLLSDWYNARISRDLRNETVSLR